MGGIGGAIGHGLGAVGGGLKHLVTGGGNADQPIDATTGQPITPDGYGPIPDVMKPDQQFGQPAWKKALAGGAQGGLQGMQPKSQPQGGGVQITPPQQVQLGPAAYGQGQQPILNPMFYGR